MKKKLNMTGSDVSIELTAITFSDEETNDRRPVTGEDVAIQGKLITSIDFQTEKMIGKHLDTQMDPTAIMRNEEQANDQQHVMGRDIKITTDSLHMLDKPHLSIGREETLGQTRSTASKKDSGNAPDDSMTNHRRFAEAITEELTSATTNTINDVRADLGSIAGYAEEPLLPLSKACSPLANILHNLSFYVQTAIDETPEQPPDGLTIDESAAIRLYTIEWESPHRSLYSILNLTLKKDDREHLRPYFKYLKLFLTALAKLPCVSQSTVWRGVTKDLSAEFQPSTTVTWWAFSSCTTALPVLESEMYLGNTGSRTLFSVEAINARTIRAHSCFDTESEVLLLPGTHMIVQSQLNPAPDLHIIHLKQIIPEKVLLELPFEGIFNVLNYFF